MSKESAKDLYDRYLEGNCTPDEMAQLEKGTDQFAYSSEEKIHEIELMESHRKMHGVLERNNIPVPALKKTLPLPFRFMSVAAIIVAILGVGTYFFLLNRQSTNLANDVEPGSNKAVLILASGKEIVLDDAKNGELAEQKGVKITKNKAGQLVYNVTPVNIAPAAPGLNNKISPTTSESSGTPAPSGDTGGLNAVRTPKGGQYEIILPDGTKVWLNAASSLKFPSTFLNLGERKVELIGEAYFEVAKVTATLLGKSRKSKRIPFIVKTPQQEVTVLGTHFNINSYKDEPNTKTTLLEGSVSVKIPEAWGASSVLSSRPMGTPERGVEKILKPGEQSINTGSAINIVDADVEQAIAWKNGEFMFRNEPLESIMRKVARWYDVEVVYESKLSEGKPFGGTISKFGKVSDVLNMLELTGQVKFKIKDRKITVLK